MESKKSQQRFNANTREMWGHFESHRRKVTELIVGLADGFHSPSVAILGAGNGNDINYSQLCEHYSAVHLFDFDSQALKFLNETQLAELSTGKVVIEPEVDLSGVANELNSNELASESQVAGLIDVARRNAAPLQGRHFDVVVSSCLLTQLLDSVIRVVGSEGEFRQEIMIALRDGHLRLMSRLLKAGGKGLLVTDFVSSDTLTELASAETDEDVLFLARRSIEQRNFFTGTNPWAIKQSLATMLVESPSSPWTIATPWRWHLGGKRHYLVTAVEFSKQF